MAHVSRMADVHNHTGEGPLWHPDEQRLYWVDIPVGQLYRYDPMTDEYDCVYETNSKPLSGFTIEADGGILLFTYQSIARWDPKTETVDPVTEIETNTRFNDVIADPEGRVFCGTMPSANELGNLYRLDPDGTSTVVIEGIDIPNGMGFASNRETFYLTESKANRIYEFDYDRSTGHLSDKHILIKTSSNNGMPDGMTVDENDDIWSAHWNGGRVVRYTSNGTPVDEISLPARKVASVTFGGPAYCDLYVTTALTERGRSDEGDGAGALFRISDTGANGVPEFRSRIAFN